MQIKFILPLILLLVLSNNGIANTRVPSKDVSVDASGFSHLSTADTDAQKAFVDIDSLIGSGGGGMVYPPVGLAVSTGSGWGTSITDNHANWDAGYTYRLTSASGTSPLTLSLSSNALTGSIAQANTSTDGYLSHADWNIFNGKQSAITTGTTAQYFKGDLSLGTFPTNLSDFTNGPGYITGNQSISLSGDATGSGTTAITVSVVKVNGLSVPISKTIVGTNASGQIVDASSASLSNNTTGTAANLSGTPTLPNGTKATTQTAGNNSTNLATTAYVDSGLSGKQNTISSYSTITSLWSGCSGTQYLGADGSCHNAAGSGSVTSVTFTGDGIIDSSTPSTAVTTSGTVTATPLTQTANYVLAGPTTGSAANPSFRALVAADMPYAYYKSGDSPSFVNVTAATTGTGPTTNSFTTSSYSSNTVAVTASATDTSSIGGNYSVGVSGTATNSGTAASPGPIPVRGVLGNGIYSGSGTLAKNIGVYGICTNSGVGTTTLCASIYGDTPTASSGSITNLWSGYFVSNTYVGGNLNVNGATASTIAGFDASKNLVTLATATYPSLTELSYVKGVTSAIQTQISGKQANLSLVAGTYSDGKICTYTSSGTVLNCNTTAPSGTIVGTTDTQTLTNKRITYRSVTTTQSATPTINTDNGDIFVITGLAQAVTSFTTNLSGTPVAGDMMEIEITDNGTARGLTFGTSFEETTVSLPTTTVISTQLRMFFQWDAVNSKWAIVGVA